MKLKCENACGGFALFALFVKSELLGMTTWMNTGGTFWLSVGKQMFWWHFKWKIVLKQLWQHLQIILRKKSWTNFLDNLHVSKTVIEAVDVFFLTRLWPRDVTCTLWRLRLLLHRQFLWVFISNFLQEARSLPNNFFFYFHFEEANLCEILEAQRCVFLSGKRFFLLPVKRKISSLGF